MNKKLILRILGAIFSALIIVGIFVPFVSVTGYTQSLWGVYSSVNTLYLPIMLIVFGAIGVIFFSLNFKTEFAYMSTGAVLFFIVMQTIDVLDQGTFSTLSVGYYFLAIGAIATGVIAFLSNLKTKQKEKEVISSENGSSSNMIAQIDKLYNEQPLQQEVPIQTISNNSVSPIPAEPLQQEIKPIEPVMDNQPIPEVVPQPNQATVEFQPQMNPQVIPTVEPQQNLQSNPVPTQGLQQPNPVVQEFMGAQAQQPTSNQSIPVQSTNDFNVPLSGINEESPVQPNPVVQGFTKEQTPSIPTTPDPQNNGLDIFGQPLK